MSNDDITLFYKLLNSKVLISKRFKMSNDLNFTKLYCNRKTHKT